MKILVGIDGSHFSDVALDELARRSWPKETEVLLVNAYESSVVATPEVWALPPDYFTKLDNAVLARSHSIVTSAAEKLQTACGKTLKIRCKSILGSPKAAILGEAEDWKPDLIVVGSHGYPMWERLLLGSVSQAVVAGAKCSVEVVRGTASN